MGQIFVKKYKFSFKKPVLPWCRVMFKILNYLKLISRCWQLRWWFGGPFSLQTIYRQPMVPSGHCKLWYQILWSRYTWCLYKSGSIFGMDWIQHERMKLTLWAIHKLWWQNLTINDDLTTPGDICKRIPLLLH